MNSQPHIAIVGATGAVGRELIEIIALRKFQYKSISLVASDRSDGKKMSTPLGVMTVKGISEFNFNGIDIAFFSAGGAVSRKYAPLAEQAGCLVIDNTSAFRLKSGIPLLVPGINDSDCDFKGIIANPNCSTIQIVKALSHIDKAFKLEKVIVSTYQAVSGTGNAGIEELQSELLDDSSAGFDQEASPFTRPIAHNVIPQIDRFVENDFTFEEEKVRFESRKILNRPELFVTCTAVRVPVYRGHSAAVYVECETDVNMADLIKRFQEDNEIIFYTRPEEFPTPRGISDLSQTYIGRLRQEPDNQKGIWFWVVADNLWVGAAYNAVRIAEEAVHDGIVD